MRHSFILDENAIHRGLRSRTALRLWEKLAGPCHQIVVSGELVQKYWAWLDEQRNHPELQAVANVLTRFLTSLLYDAGKSIWIGAPTPLDPSERVVHDVDDWYLEDLAVSVMTDPDYQGLCTDCCFVTVDDETRENFNHPKLQALNIGGFTLEEGLKLAEEDCEGEAQP